MGQILQPAEDGGNPWGGKSPRSGQNSPQVPGKGDDCGDCTHSWVRHTTRADGACDALLPTFKPCPCPRFVEPEVRVFLAWRFGRNFGSWHALRGKRLRCGIEPPPFVLGVVESKPERWADLGVRLGVTVITTEPESDRCGSCWPRGEAVGEAASPLVLYGHDGKPLLSPITVADAERLVITALQGEQLSGRALGRLIRMVVGVDVTAREQSHAKELAEALRNWQNYELTLEQRQNAAIAALALYEGGGPRCEFCHRALGSVSWPASEYSDDERRLCSIACRDEAAERHYTRE